MWVQIFFGLVALLPGDFSEAAEWQSCALSRVSIGPNGSSNFQALHPSVSPDGKLIVYASGASNLVPSDTNGRSDIFLYDVQNQTTSIISTGINNAPSNGDSTRPQINMGNGNYYVVYQSTATNIDGGTPGVQNIFMYDHLSGQNQRITRSVTSPLQSPFDDSFAASVSSDGKRVAFLSRAQDLIAPGQDTNATVDAYLFDLQTNQFYRINQSFGGGQTTLPIDRVRLSGNGNTVVFETRDSSIHPSDRNFKNDIYVLDLPSNLSLLAQQVPTLVTGFSQESALHSSITDDGQSVFFESDQQIFYFDRLSGTRTKLDIDGAQVFYPEVSRNGQFLTFTTSSALYPDHDDFFYDVYLYHVPTKRRIRASSLAATTGQLSDFEEFNSLTNGSNGPLISDDGLVSAFVSNNWLLNSNVPPDSDDLYDVYMNRCVFDPEIPDDCTGSGQASCPCGNIGAPDRGCANSFDPQGAKLTADGSAVLSANQLRFRAEGIPPLTQVALVGGESIGSVPGLFGDGLRCVQLPMDFGAFAMSDTQGRIEFGFETPNPLQVSTSVQPFEPLLYQLVFRDSNSQSPCGFNSNSTNAVEVIWLP